MLRRLSNVLLAATQIVLPALLFPNGFEASPLQKAGPAPSPAEPAGYAFAIWGLIYAGSLAYAVYAVFPAEARDPLLQRIGWLTAGGFLLTNAWLLAARFGPLWATVPIIIGMLILIGSAFLIAARWPGAARRSSTVFVVTPLAVFAGWLTPAAFINAVEVMITGDQRLGISIETISIGAIAAAAALGCAALRASRWNAAYAVTLIWALTGIVAANVQRQLSSEVALTAGALAAGMLALFIVARLNGRRPRLRPTGVSGGSGASR